MKKILTIAIAAMIVVMCFALVSCGHECEFKAEWTHNATHHWHDCTDEECELTSDNAEHTWNEGVVTVPPTEVIEGVKTFTCTVCSATKVESISKCVFSTEWSKDDTHHWHVCTTHTDCANNGSYDEHNWNAGEITTPATQGAAGVKTFTCTECGGTKTEPVAFTGLTATEWSAAFGIANFENFYWYEKATTKVTGMTMDVITEYKFTANKALLKMTMLGDTMEETVTDQITVDAYREQVVSLLGDYTTHADYTYNADTKTYTANKAINIAGVGETDTVTIKFDDAGRITEVAYSIHVVEAGVEMDVEYLLTIEYGNVEL